MMRRKFSRKGENFGIEGEREERMEVHAGFEKRVSQK